MAATFPSSTKSFTTKTDGPGNTIFAAHVNDLQDELVAVENDLLSGVAHDLKPDANSTRSFGATSLRWLKGWFSTLDVSGIITLNARPYTWPASESSGGVLQTDGSGALTWTVSGLVQALDKSLTEQSVSNTTSETSIYTPTIAANTLVAGKALRLRVTGNLANTSGGAVNVTVKIKLGGTTIFNSGLTSIGNGFSIAPFVIEALINANNATNSQRAFAVWQYPTANTSDGGANTPVAASQGGHSSLAVDMTSSQTLDVTVTWASAATTITVKRWAAILELVP